MSQKCFQMIKNISKITRIILDVESLRSKRKTNNPSDEKDKTYNMTSVILPSDWTKLMR